jgi:hypothetical protein
VVKPSGMPSAPNYETGDDTIAIGDLVRVPGSGSGFIKDGEIGTVIALDSSYTGPCKSYTGPCKSYSGPCKRVTRAT